MLRGFIASLLILSLALPLPVRAGMVTTPEALDRAEVRALLVAYGVSAAEAEARVAALTDDEAAELAARIDSLPTGGVSIIGAALVVFLVLLVTDILGYTKVFPFTRPIK